MSRYLVACDAGGTMTDVILVDEEGKFVIGKAPTTPHDESIGFMESFDEALTYWDMAGKVERSARMPRPPSTPVPACSTRCST